MRDNVTLSIPGCPIGRPKRVTGDPKLMFLFPPLHRKDISFPKKGCDLPEAVQLAIRQKQTPFQVIPFPDAWDRMELTRVPGNGNQEASG